MSLEQLQQPSPEFGEPPVAIHGGEPMAAIRPVKVPPEAQAIFAAYQQEKGLSDEQMAELTPTWYPNPALHPRAKRLMPQELHSRQIDIYAAIQPLLGRRELDGTLRTMDIANGCSQQCDTCFIDAVLPSNIISKDSLESLFDDPYFQRMLQPDSFRIGSAGDIVDHPQAVDVVEMILSKTQFLDERRMQAEGKHHTIKIYTNYRKNHEKELLGLLELAEQSNDRLLITISLPNNRIDTVNRQFKEFATAHADLLQMEPYSASYLPRHLTGFVYKHPELLTSMPTQQVMEDFVDYLQAKVKENDIRDWHTEEQFTREALENRAKRHIKFLPSYIKDAGSVDAYYAKLQQLDNEDSYHRDLDPGKIRNPHVAIQDVRAPMLIYTWGRIVTDAVLIARDQMVPGNEENSLVRAGDFEQRGLAKTFLNPDGLWLHIYTTPEESHTNRVYTPITPQNLEMLSRVPFNPEFPTPPNWPGGTGEFNTDYQEDLQHARSMYAELKGKLNIVE